MTHIELDTLVRLREPGREPGLAEAEKHLAECAECRREADRLEQRVARLKALPTLKPSRDAGQWCTLDSAPITASVLDGSRPGPRDRGGIALLLLVRGATSSSSLNASTALSEAMTRSGQLDQLLESYNADGRITDGHTDGMAGALEDQIARIDRQLEMAQLLRARERDTALLNLYRERIGLLDALMDVHVTRASNVGL
jgi:hypothetical protein